MKRWLVALAAVIMTVSFGCKKKNEDVRPTLELKGNSSIKVAIDGRPISDLPVMLKVPAGRHVLKFYGDTYVSRWDNVVLKDKETRALDISLEPERACVLVASSPSGASLEMDGKVVGSTPLVLESLPVGKYTGQLKMPGYEERGVNWEINDSRPLRVFMDLSSNIGKVELTASPKGSRIFINGTLVGPSPYFGELSEGKYLIRIEREGYIPVEQHIVLRRGEILAKEFNLTPLPGGIGFASFPDGAEVFVNGVKRGVTPCVLNDLPPAIYDIKLIRPGYDDYTAAIEVASGGSDKVNVQLSPSTGRLILNIRPPGVEVFVDGKSYGKVEREDKDSLASKFIVVPNLTPGEHEVVLSHKQAVPETKRYTFKIEKAKDLKPPALSLWLANYELTFTDGRVERGAVYEENDERVVFGPEPGVKFPIPRNQIKSITKLTIGDE